MAKQDLSASVWSKEFKTVRRNYLQARGWTLKEAKAKFTLANIEELMVEYVKHLRLVPDGALVKIERCEDGWCFHIMPRKALS